MPSAPMIGHRLLALLLTICLVWVGLPLRIVVAGPAEPAAATGAKAAILPLEVQGELSDADRETLASELVEGLRRGDFDIVTPEEVSAASADAQACHEAACIKKVASATSATHVVRARVVVEDRDYDVQVELYDAGSGGSLAKSQEGCEICGIVDAGNLMAAASATLRTKLDALARGPSTLVVTSTPTETEVRIDGELVGTTPLQRPVIPGKRVLRISKEGFIAIEREVTFVEGVEETLTFELEKVPSRLPSRPWGWVSLGVGIASVGTAIGFAVLGGTDREYKVGKACEGPRVDADGDCERIWNTEWIVLGTALAGAALTTLGVAVLLSTGKRRDAKKTRRKRASIGIGPGSFVIRGRF